MKYKITIFHEMLVVYRNTSYLRSVCIYKRVDVMAQLRYGDINLSTTDVHPNYT